MVGRYFKTEKTTANAIFRMFQSLGGGICYLSGGLFVDQGATSSTPQQLLQEVMLSSGFFVVCFLCYMIFYVAYERRNRGTVELAQTLVEEN